MNDLSNFRLGLLNHHVNSRQFLMKISSTLRRFMVKDVVGGMLIAGRISL